MPHHLAFPPTLLDALADMTPLRDREVREARCKTPVLAGSWLDSLSQRQGRWLELHEMCGATLRDLSSKFYSHMAQPNAQQLEEKLANGRPFLEPNPSQNPADWRGLRGTFGTFGLRALQPNRERRKRHLFPRD